MNQRIEELMVLAADGNASDEELKELEVHLKQNPELSKELSAHKEIKTITDNWMKRIKVDLVEDTQRESRNLEQNFGALLFVLGMAILMGFGLVEGLLDPEAPVWLRIGLGLVIAGSVVLLYSVFRQRQQTLKNDKYTEIIR